METLACRYPPPWPDLHDPLLEEILERLPLSGYVRFSAVCRRWRSVQTSHRRRHFPSPPPMLRLPWLIPDPLAYKKEKGKENVAACYSPFEDIFFTIALPSSPGLLSLSSQGWLLRSDDDSGKDLNLFNPISAAKIHLPPLINTDWPLPNHAIAVSPPPNYAVSNINSSTISFLHWLDPSWTQLKLPPRMKPFKLAVSCGAKHYCICYDIPWIGDFNPYDLLVVDPLSSPPTIEYFEMMGWSKRRPEETGWSHSATYLVEFDEEPLLVKEIVRNDGREMTVGFEVLRADLDRKVWVRVESIGTDRVLMLHWFGSYSVSLLAADIGSRGNCIYFSSEENSAESQWRVFDLGTGRVTDSLLPNASQIEKYSQLLFAPSLC